VTTFLLPVAVMTMSTLRITSFSFTMRKPSMLTTFYTLLLHIYRLKLEHILKFVRL
jgi:hypothetical protein